MARSGLVGPPLIFLSTESLNLQTLEANKQAKLKYKFARCTPPPSEKYAQSLEPGGSICACDVQANVLKTITPSSE